MSGSGVSTPRSRDLVTHAHLERQYASASAAGHSSGEREQTVDSVLRRLRSIGGRDICVM